MRRRASVALFACLGPFCAAQAEELRIEGAGISRDVACEGDDVGIYGAMNVVTLTGECARITVHGANHAVAFEKGTVLAVSGAANKVRGGEVSDLTVSVANNAVSATIAPQAGEGRVEISGAQNEVTLVLAARTALTVMGADQTVTWSAAPGVPQPAVSASGAGHAIRRKP